MCACQKGTKKTQNIDTDIQCIICDILLMGNFKSLTRRVLLGLEDLFEIRVAIKCLLKNIKAMSAVDKQKGLCGVKLPTVSVATFDGKVLKWKSFWEQFDATIHCKTGLNNPERLMYLQEALKHGPARIIIQGLTQNFRELRGSH